MILHIKIADDTASQKHRVCSVKLRAIVTQNIKSNGKTAREINGDARQNQCCYNA